MNQRGFAMTGMLWGALAAGVVILSLTGAVYVQTIKLSACKAEFSEFKGGVEALGKAAKREADDQAMRDKIFKENADEQNARALATLRADIKLLRDKKYPGRSVLSAPAPTPGSPDRVCFNRTVFNGALQRFDDGVVGTLQRFDEGVLGVVEISGKAVVDLDTSKLWAKEKYPGQSR